MPIEQGVDNLVKEISTSGRTYSVFDLARVVLGARERFQLVFKSEAEKGLEMLQCSKDHAVFLSKEEAVSHASQAGWLNEIYASKEVESEAPSGSFSTIAKCGLSGEILGPTNFHGYQERLRELHQAKYSHMPFEKFKSRIQTDSGEEVVAQWKESMTKKTVYSLISNNSMTFDSRSAMIQHFVSSEFDKVFLKTYKAMVPSEIEAKKLSSSLLASLKECIREQKRYPGELSSFLCRQLSGRQLAVFKWQGKLHCGPSRPHALPDDLVLADRLKLIHSWVGENEGCGVDQLWKDVCPEGIDEKAKFEWYHDLHWLLNQGYVVLMDSGHLFPSSAAKKSSKKAEPFQKQVSAQQVKVEIKKEEEVQVSTEQQASSDNETEPEESSS